MPHIDSLSTPFRPVLPLPFDPGWTRRGADLGVVETGMARAFDAIRTYARIAWWDGSAVGLRLHGFVGLFELDEADASSPREDRR